MQVEIKKKMFNFANFYAKWIYVNIDSIQVDLLILITSRNRPKISLFFFVTERNLSKSLNWLGPNLCVSGNLTFITTLTQYRWLNFLNRYIISKENRKHVNLSKSFNGFSKSMYVSFVYICTFNFNFMSKA